MPKTASKPVRIRLNGRMLARNSTIDYQYAWLMTDLNGRWFLLSFHRSVQSAHNAQHPISRLRVAPGKIGAFAGCHPSDIRLGVLVPTNSDIVLKARGKIFSIQSLDASEPQREAA